MRVPDDDAILDSDDGCSDEDTPSLPVQTAEEVAELFEILSVTRRVYAISVLAEFDSESVEVSTLVEQVAELEYSAEYSERERERVYVALYQSHLPTLQEARVVEYYQERGVVKRGIRFEQVERLLRVVAAL
ncbi:DUF7344 domain-containing protein [Halobaculum limi]|uniref:DUF7344 domain-containing protein n=1 Tax=Halobaculum limi TaxID=3031916 RepID=UPI0024054D2B|nr:hypothetical protein [Halobaculum sp. YSMS11]